MIDFNIMNVLTIGLIALIAWAILQFGQRFTGYNLIPA